MSVGALLAKHAALYVSTYRAMLAEAERQGTELKAAAKMAQDAALMAVVLAETPVPPPDDYDPEPWRRSL